MPCNGCPQNKTMESGTVRQFYPGLDALDNAFTVAYTEVSPENRENIDLMRQLTQKIRSESPRPDSAQWQALFIVLTQKILPYINCPYCRRATEIDLVAGAQVHWLFDQGKYWQGLKLSVRRDIQKYWWMMKAGYYKLLKPILLDRIQRCTRILRRPLSRSSTGTPAQM